MSDLYTDALKILEQRKVKFVDKFVPYLLCSYATHVLNLENKKRKFYLEHDRVPDLRLHVLEVAPPGYGKSFIMKQLMGKDTGLLVDGSIELRFEGYSTESGMIGSVERSGQTVTQIQGLFEEYSNGILGFEEFFSITQAMTQSHSAHLEPALNQALLDGDVRKRLRAGPIEYTTNTTVWAGTQTTKFEVGGGLLRRFLLLNWTPTDAESQELKKALREGINLALDPNILLNYRQRIKNFNNDLKIIKDIAFDPALFDLTTDVPHYREPVLMKLALGYALMTQPIERSFVVGIDDKISRLIVDVEDFRKKLIGDAEGSLVMSIVEEHDGKIGYKQLKNKLIDYSIRYDSSEAMIRRLIANHDLISHKDYIYTNEAYKKENHLV